MMQTIGNIKKGLACHALCRNDHLPCSGCAYHGPGLPPCSKAVHEDAMALIEQMEAQVPKWISVEERLPIGQGWVLAIGLMLKKKSKGDYGWCVPHVAEYRHGRWCDLDGMLPDLEERSLRITHWMTLPEPPKEDDHV